MYENENANEKLKKWILCHKFVYIKNIKNYILYLHQILYEIAKKEENNMVIYTHTHTLS